MLICQRNSNLKGLFETLQENLQGDREPFLYTVRHMKKNFSERVRDVVSRIPKGKTLPYMEVARLAGNQRAARAVGTIMKNNYDSSIPCHRVIRADGNLGDYNRGKVLKRKLLEAEGAI
jgi:O-6-methylguanine DNA methyltransferase